jgi:hypothetical protein
MNTRAGSFIFLIVFAAGWCKEGEARPKRVFQVPNASAALCRTCHVDRGRTTTRLDIPLSETTHEATNEGDAICASCHTYTGGGGPLNAFGVTIKKGFLSESGYSGNVMWGPSLARIDSDRDGFTNGNELGDPAGNWRPGDRAPGRRLSLSNPGFFNSVPVHSPGGVGTEHRSDFNEDGKVDFTDFSSFATAFGTSNGDGNFDPVFDLNGDGAVNFEDFIQFAGDFGAGA